MKYTWAVLGVFCGAISAQAQEEEVVVTRTEVTEEEVSRGYLSDEKVGLKPQLGAIFLNDSTGDETTRGAIGFALEANLLGNSNLYLGPSTGGIFSHVGAPGSNFFGTDSPGGAGTSANFLLIPADLKLGMLLPGDTIRVSVRGGGNVVYQSVANAVSLGDPATTPSGSSWNFYPNVGADFEFGPVMVRPDWTITPGNDLFTLTAGFVFPLG